MWFRGNREAHVESGGWCGVVPMGRMRRAGAAVGAGVVVGWGGGTGQGPMQVDNHVN